MNMKQRDNSLIGVMFKDSNLRLKYMLEQGLIRKIHETMHTIRFLVRARYLEYIATYNLDYFQFMVI